MNAIKVIEQAVAAFEDLKKNHRMVYVNELVDLRQLLEDFKKNEPAAEVRDAYDCQGLRWFTQYPLPTGTPLYDRPQPNSEFVGVLETLLRALENEQDRNRLEDVCVDATNAAVLLGRQYLGLVNKQEK